MVARLTDMPSPLRSAISRDNVHVRSEAKISDEAWEKIGPMIEGLHRAELDAIASRYWTWKGQLADRPTEAEGNATLRRLVKDLARFDALERHEQSILFASLTQIDGAAGERFFHELYLRAAEDRTLNPLEPETYPVAMLLAALNDAVIATSGPQRNSLIKQTVADIAAVFDQVHGQTLTHSNGPWGDYQQRSVSAGGDWVTQVMLEIDPTTKPSEISAALAGYIKRRNVARIALASGGTL